MKLHAQAALTLEQRQEVKRLHAEGLSIRRLAQRFGVNPTTIQRWTTRDSPLDRSSAPLTPQTVITPEYRAAVIGYRMKHQNHGPLRIARELQGLCPWANRGTVLTILQQEGLTRLPKREQNPSTALPAGRQRIHLDIQQLPDVQGGKGFEYKISAIHLRTRLKYTEIHADRKPATVAGVLKRALNLLPVLNIFQQEGLAQLPKREKAPSAAIFPAGRHRIQLDIQQLPAVQGAKGLEYKISAIHLCTRLKYTEIHADRKSATVAAVLQQALDLLSPFFPSGPATPMSSP